MTDLTKVCKALLGEIGHKSVNAAELAAAINSTAEKVNNAKYFAEREYEGIHPVSKMSFDGQWVVRDANGNFVDSDRYKNDLKTRYPGIVFLAR